MSSDPCPAWPRVRAAEPVRDLAVCSSCGCPLANVEELDQESGLWWRDCHFCETSNAHPWLEVQQPAKHFHAVAGEDLDVGDVVYIDSQGKVRKVKVLRW